MQKKSIKLIWLKKFFFHFFRDTICPANCIVADYSLNMSLLTRCLLVKRPLAKCLMANYSCRKLTLMIKSLHRLANTLFILFLHRNLSRTWLLLLHKLTFTIGWPWSLINVWVSFPERHFLWINFIFQILKREITCL